MMGQVGGTLPAGAICTLVDLKTLEVVADVNAGSIGQLHEGQASEVSKVYKRDAFEVPVLNGVMLAVPRGDFLALMGPSGSGKTTLLNLIAGINRPTGGRIAVDGKEISRFSETQLASWRARHAGFIFQMYNLIPVLNAFEVAITGIVIALVAGIVGGALPALSAARMPITKALREI